ncbi:hypothetical protein BGX33_000349, partial [Mortierella sp. NVP41]
MIPTSQPSRQVLELFELVSLVGTFLDPPDLLSCVQVSRLWSNAMIPSLWHTIDDTDYQWPKILQAHDYTRAPRIVNGKDRDWIMAIFKKYGTWIRVLNIHWKVILEVAYFCGTCTNLQTLTLSNPFKNRTKRERLREEHTRTGLTNIRGLIARVPLLSSVFDNTRPAGLEGRVEIQQELEWTVTQLFQRLIQQNRDLSGVRMDASLRDIQIVDFPASLYDTLASTHGLLVLENHADCDDLGALLERMQRLRFYGSNSGTVSSSPFQKSLPSLQALRLQGCIDTRLFASMLRHLPNLQSLWAGGFQTTTPYCEANFIHEARSNIGPTSLRLIHLGNNSAQLEDRMLRAILPCMPKLLHLTTGKLEKDTIVTLVESCQEVESVALSVEQESSTPANILSILLEGCPRLRVLDASGYNVDATQLEGRRWICSGLEVLKCQILGIEPLPRTEEVISTSSGDFSRQLVGEQSVFLMRQQSRFSHHQVYSHLAGLAKLTTLVLWLDPIFRGFGSLEFTLESGLGQLSTLTELEVFGFDGMTDGVGPAELAWIARSWPRLRLLYGLQPSATPMTIEDPAKDALRAHFTTLRPD